MKYIKPPKLKIGDTVAVVSPSWGGPDAFPHIYAKGLENLRSLGLKVKEYPTARMDEDTLTKNPEIRAKDINDAFADTEVKAIICSIGGDDSIRLLPYLDKEVAIKNPKILMGYSDNTTLLIYFNLIGLVTFHGPTVMSGLAQIDSVSPLFKKHLQEILFENKEKINFPNYDSYSEGYPDWSIISNVGKVNEPKTNEPWFVVQGEGTVEGKLIGGCVEVIDFMKGTEFYPDLDFFKNKIFFLETSEEKPTVEDMRRILRNYGVQGFFHNIKALVFGKFNSYSYDEKNEFYAMVKDVVINEFKNENLPIVANLNFGHMDPQWVLPLGVEVSININRNEFTLIENCLS